MHSLTARQKEFYIVISQKVRPRGPSLTEITRDLKTTNKVAIGILQSLIRKGHIIRISKHEYVPIEQNNINV